MALLLAMSPAPVADLSAMRTPCPVIEAMTFCQLIGVPLHTCAKATYSGTDMPSVHLRTVTMCLCL